MKARTLAKVLIVAMVAGLAISLSSLLSLLRRKQTPALPVQATKLQTSEKHHSQIQLGTQGASSQSHSTPLSSVKNEPSPPRSQSSSQVLGEASGPAPRPAVKIRTPPPPPPPPPPLPPPALKNSATALRPEQVQEAPKLQTLPQNKCIHFYVYASHPGRDDKFCRSLRSAVLAGIDLEVLGWGVKWEGLHQKIKGTISTLQRLDPECTFVFADAFDVLYQKGNGSSVASAIQEKFERHRRETGAEMMYSGECSCWPVDPICTSTSAFPIPGSSPTRYLNSGSYVATARSALRLQSFLWDAYTAKKVTRFNDQALTAQAFRENRTHFAMTLDYRRDMFATFHSVKNTKLLADCDPNPDFVFTGGGWYNKREDTWPNLLHFNGGSKNKMTDMEKKLFSSAEKLPDVQMKFEGGSKKMSDVCPAFFKKG